MRLLMSESEKYARDKENVKAIVSKWQLDGETQVSYRRDRICRLENLANGVLNQEDYIEYEGERDLFSSEGIELEDAGLSFYPIIPNIINGVLGAFDKRYSEYYVEAINPEHTNEILESMTKDLRDSLIRRAEQAFLSPETTEEEYQQFMSSEQIRDYHLTEYRSTVEQWANHTKNIDTERLRMKEIERQTLRDIMVSEMPAIHVNYLDGNYTVESLRPEDCFYIKSKYKTDYSEGQMFGWFEDDTLGSVLNKYANLLNEDDVERVNGWTDDIYGTDLVVNHGQYTGNVDGYRQSAQNYRALKSLLTTSRSYDDYYSDTVRVTHMYFLLPVRQGKLRYKGDGVDIHQIVSDDFKVTIKPVYDGEKKVENLISGEHVEWFYKNELWRSIQVDVKQQSWKVDESTDQNTLWLVLEKNRIQYSDPDYRFGVRLPIHGGPTTNLFSDPVSPVEKAAPFQVMYNWLWNRSQQLLSTEVGKFIIFNQNMIPQESFDGTWGKSNLLKWFTVAKDTSMAPADPSVTNMGQSASQIAGGFGQVVDLTKTQELLEKAALSRMIKEECFQQFGFTGSTLYGDISPQQTGASQAQQLDRSLTQIQTYYTRLDNIMRRVWDTILETAQFKASLEGTQSISYMGDDKARVIFNLNTSNILLHKLATYTKSSAADSHTLESIKNVALSSNTMGANSWEMASMLSSKSTPELMSKLQDITNDKNFQREQEAQQEASRQQQLLQQQHNNNMEALAEKARQDEIKFERDVVLKQIQAVGYGNSPAEDIAKQTQLLAKQDLERDKFRAILDHREKINAQRQDQASLKERQHGEKLSLQEKIELEKLQVRREEIAAANKRTKAID